MLNVQTIVLFRFYSNKQSWAPATLKVAALPLQLFGKKSSAAAACRYLNKKVAPLPLPLLAYNKQRLLPLVAAATLEKYLAKRTMAYKYGTQ